MTLAETKKAKKHIVVFQDEEGNVLKTSFVSHEEAALPPEMPEKRGESVHHEIKFQGWDKDISSVKENLVVKAVYKEEKTNTWRVIYHYTDWTGERKQSQKRGGHADTAQCAGVHGHPAADARAKSGRRAH